MGIMKFIENYYNMVMYILYHNKFIQKNLEKRFNEQPRICKCGFPIPSQNIIIHEGFFKIKRIYREVDYTCQICKHMFKIIG